MSTQREARRRLSRAAFAPSFPNAVRVRLESLLIVRFREAAFAAFRTLRRAALRCRAELMVHRRRAVHCENSR